MSLVSTGPQLPQLPHYSSHFGHLVNTETGCMSHNYRITTFSAIGTTAEPDTTTHGDFYTNSRLTHDGLAKALLPLLVSHSARASAPEDQ